MPLFLGDADGRISDENSRDTVRTNIRDPEVLVALGTDPDHPEELGAEYEICMGPEMEKHVVSKPSLVFIPSNFIHCPFTVRKVTRPFIFIEAQYAPKSIETSLRDMVPADMRNKYIFIDSDGASDKGKPRLPRKAPPKKATELAHSDSIHKSLEAHCFSL